MFWNRENFSIIQEKEKTKQNTKNITTHKKLRKGKNTTKQKKQTNKKLKESKIRKTKNETNNNFIICKESKMNKILQSIYAYVMMGRWLDTMTWCRRVGKFKYSGNYVTS